MNDRNTSNKTRLRGLLLLLLASYTCVSYAGEYDGELKRFDFEIEFQAIEKLNKEFRFNDFVKSLNLTVPIYPVKLSPKQVKLKIENALQVETNQKYDPARYDEIKKEAEEKYAMFKIGDKASIQRQYGSQLIEVTGLLEGISTDMVKISGLPIPTVDIRKEDLARLYWTDHENAVAKQIRNKTRKFEEERAEFIESSRAKISKNIWIESGYRKLKKSKRWVPVLDLALHKYDKAREKKLESLRDTIRKQTYEENNYIFDPQSDGWIPRQVIIDREIAEEERNRTLLDRVKLFFRKKSDQEESSSTSKTINKEADKKVEDKSSGPEKVVDSEDDPNQDEEEDLWDEEFEEKSGEEPSATSESKDEKNTQDEKFTETDEGDVSDLFDEDFE